MAPWSTERLLEYFMEWLTKNELKLTSTFTEKWQFWKEAKEKLLSAFFWDGWQGAQLPEIYRRKESRITGQCSRSLQFSERRRNEGKGEVLFLSENRGRGGRRKQGEQDKKHVIWHENDCWMYIFGKVEAKNTAQTRLGKGTELICEGQVSE